MEPDIRSRILCRAVLRDTRNTVNALQFELNAEANLLALQRKFRDHTYHPGRSICIITDGRKPREVFAAEFRDRVVHHLLVSRGEPIFERRFIHDSDAGRKGKGTLAASDRLMQFPRRVTANGQRAAWALKLAVVFVVERPGGVARGCKVRVPKAMLMPSMIPTTS